MTAELYLAQTAPCFAQFEYCDAGHMHVQFNWVSYLPPMPHEDPEDIQIHPVTGEIARPAGEITFSLN